MNTTNQRFFQIFGLVLLGVGAFALVNANSSWVNANTEETQTTQTVSASNTYSRRRHTISLTLNELDDLKVIEGQRVNVGDLISDSFAGRRATSHLRQRKVIDQKAEVRSSDRQS